ncbi:MAG: NADH-quinone oxidoreductase subunit C [Clostridiales bacterium]|nr:NADH-quinone oxidoreductase subunit C [Clostridiales bacterium]MDU1027951.1 NADH-quinone oxidoreductase subunit C [Clostridiales bacterium]
MTLDQQFGALTAVETPGVNPTYLCSRDDLVETVTTLKAALTPLFLVDVTALEREEDLCGIYHFMNLNDYIIFRVVVPMAKDDLHLPTISDIYPAANEMEREVYDLFGIVYDNHPNLKRILCADDFEGHPLRKDYVSNTRD